MKSTLITAAIAALLSGSLDNGWAQSPERVFPVVELTDADLEHIDLHDGSIGDWLDAVGEAPINALDFNYDESFGRQPYDPADLDFRIWLAWHDATNRIYVAMERADDVYVNQFVREPTQLGDMFEHDSAVGISVDGDGGRRDPFDAAFSGSAEMDSEEFYQLLNRDSQAYGAIAETFDDGPRLHLSGFGPLSRTPQSEYGDWYVRPPYAEGGGRHFGEKPTISVTEFYITPFDFFVWNDPDESRISDLSLGKVVNFAMVIRDVEGQVDYSSGARPEESVAVLFMWQDGLLLGPDGVLPPGAAIETAVEDITWGRIKATFGR